MLLRKKLVKIFAAAAIFSSVLGVLPTPLVQEAKAVTVSTAGTSAMMAAAAARRAREDREALNDVIANPTPKNIANAQFRGVIDDTMAPYVAKTVAAMRIAPGTKASDISESRRDQFLQGLRDRRLVAEMSAGTGAQAVRLGMSSGLQPYFETTKAEFGYEGAVTLAQAEAMQVRMKEKHWQNDTRPALIRAGAVFGTLGTVGALGYALKRYNRGY